MANFRYSMRGRRSAFSVASAAVRTSVTLMGQDIDPQETAVHRVEVSGQYSAFGALTLFRLQA